MADRTINLSDNGFKFGMREAASDFVVLQGLLEAPFRDNNVRDFVKDQISILVIAPMPTLATNSIMSFRLL